MNPLEVYLNHVPSPIWSHLSHIESFLLAFLASIYIFKPHQKKKILKFCLFPLQCPRISSLLFALPCAVSLSNHFKVKSTSSS